MRALIIIVCLIAIYRGVDPSAWLIIVLALISIFGELSRTKK